MSHKDHQSLLMGGVILAYICPLGNPIVQTPGVTDA